MPAYKAYDLLSQERFQTYFYIGNKAASIQISHKFAPSFEMCSSMWLCNNEVVSLECVYICKTEHATVALLGLFKHALLTPSTDTFLLLFIFLVFLFFSSFRFFFLAFWFVCFLKFTLVPFWSFPFLSHFFFFRSLSHNILFFFNFLSFLSFFFFF